MKRFALLLALLFELGCASSSNAPPPAADCEGFPMPNPVSSALPRPQTYTTNADGTIADDVTGLVWEGAASGAVFMQAEALAHCAAKGDGWRLPTRLELVSLVDFTVTSPAPTIGAAFVDAPANLFWTSSLYYGDAAGDAWYVGFDEGYSDYGIINQSYLARCVRAPAPRCFAERYEVQDDGLVLDHATGLVWQRALDPRELSWDDAVAYCAGLGGGFRAPSLTEAQTIIEDTHEFPAVDPTAFPDTPSVDFWTSSLKAGDPAAAWYVDFFYGATDTDVTARQFRVRCVR